MTTQLRVNDAQRFVLSSLKSDGEADAHEIAERMNVQENGSAFYNPRWGYRVSYDRAHAILARLEKRGLVERKGAPGKAATWYVSSLGRQAIA